MFKVIIKGYFGCFCTLNGGWKWSKKCLVKYQIGKFVCQLLLSGFLHVSSYLSSTQSTAAFLGDLLARAKYGL